MSNEATPGATPEKDNSGTPPTPAPATPSGNQEGTVTLSKEEADQLKRDAARAASNQRKADLYDRTVGSGKGHFKPITPITPPTEDEKQEQAAIEDRKAERGLFALAADPTYREALDADPMLRDLLFVNPLAVLSVFAPDAFDAEDAISLVKERLAVRVAEIKAKAILPATPPVTPPATPSAGGVNPPGATTPDAEYEEARKNPNIHQAISGMVKVGLKKLGGK